MGGLSVKIIDLEKIIEKAKSKKNGVYSFDGRFRYIVINKQLCFIASRSMGAISQFAYGFLSPVGQVPTWELDKELKKLLKQQESR